MNVYKQIILDSHKLETTIYSSIGEWVNKLWYVHIMECYQL